MNKEKILTDFDDFTSAKKTNARIVIACFVFAIVVIITVLIWAASVTQTAINKIIVVERSGEYLKISADTSEKLFISLVKNTCATATIYANSFDRITINENQAKAAFYVNQNALQGIFLKYQNDGSYHEAIQNGVVYKCEMETFESITGEEEPYIVNFTAILSIIYKEHITKIRIKSRGEIIKTTPQYPDNITGFYLRNLAQTFEKYKDGTSN